MKKVLGLIMVFVASLALVACKKEKNDENTINLNGMDFVIMVNSKNSNDPRLETYAKLFQEEKVAKIEEVEKKYNINVVYEDYPSNASWGGARERWIVEQSTLGTAPAHVFEVASTSIATLAVQDAILPLDDLIETLGVKGYWPEKKVFGQVLGKTYLYDDSYPISDEGLYYNSELLGQLLGEERKLEPTKKWLDGTWTWDAFEALAKELNAKLDHNRSEEDGGAQYVMGGRSYNYVYSMLGTNGASLVDSDFKTHLAEEPVLELLTYLNGLYKEEGMWIDNAPLANASQPEFTNGNVVFHNGQSWHLSASNKWGNAKFDIDFVPFPKGPRVVSGEAEYTVSHVYGKSAHAISSAYSKDRIPEGYEDSMIHSETIFKIWNDLQYFPEFDSSTNLVDTTPIYSDFINKSLRPHYGNKESLAAHEDVISLARPDFFYSFSESQAHLEGSFMLEIQSAIHVGDARTRMVSVKAALEAIIQEQIFNKGIK